MILEKIKFLIEAIEGKSKKNNTSKKIIKRSIYRDNPDYKTNNDKINTSFNFSQNGKMSPWDFSPFRINIFLI